jgi:proteasome lid subunit RPN8/RPN11
MTNAAASSQIYRLDGKEMMAVEREADGAGLEIIGVMHSHTHTSAYPSPTDVRDAEMSDPFGMWHFVIVSLKHPDPALRSFRILDGQVSEEAVTVV